MPFYLLTYRTATHIHTCIRQAETIYEAHARDFFLPIIPEGASDYSCEMTSSLLPMFKRYELDVWKVEDIG